MDESQLQCRVTDLCDLLGLTWHHEVDSRRSKAGFPDLVIVGSRIVFAELKAEKGRVTSQQQFWLDALREAGAETYLWRPSDWSQIQAVLYDLARKPVRQS